MNLQYKCSLEDNTEGEEDGSWHEGDPKLGPEERKAARNTRRKVKEEKREARKTKKSQAKKKRRKKMAKA